MPSTPARLIDVNADDLGIDLLGRVDRGGVDAAAAGEDDLSAALIPGIHHSGDVGVAEELAAVDVVDLDIGETHVGRSGVNALHEAVAVTDDRGNGHAAEEAEVLIAELHSRVTGHVAAELFLINSAVDVAHVNVLVEVPILGGVVVGFARLGNGGLEQVAGGDVERDELHIGELGSGLNDGAAESVAGHNDDIEAIVNGLFDHGDTVGGVIAGGLEVAELDAVVLGKRLAGLIGGLVEGLVGDVAVVGDHGDFVGDLVGVATGVLVIGLGLVLLAASDQRQSHDQSQNHSKKLFHVLILPS